MNTRKFLLPSFFGIAAAAFAVFYIPNKFDIYAQEKPISVSVKSEFAIANTSVKPASSSAKSFAKSVAENNSSRFNLKWAFGGKPQIGWQIYMPLIQKEIAAEDSPESAEFAAKLAEWQAKNDLFPNGILDNETLAVFIKIWQSRRLNSSVYPADEQLYAAPISDFYDPTRSAELLKLERETYAAYKKMLAAAAADKSLKLKVTKSGELAAEEKFMRIVSAFRSREYQEKLRLASPNSGRAGLAKHSPHFTGRALDIYVGGEPVTTRDDNRLVQIETPVYKWLVKNAHGFGFYPYFYEPWHWEYVGAVKN